MNTQRNVASFLIRFVQDLWQDAQGDPHVQWRGYINHVQADKELSFTDFSEALNFIQGQLSELTVNAIPEGSQMEPEQVLRESFRLWEQFAATYSGLMFNMMEQTLQSSRAFRDQMERAVEQAVVGRGDSSTEIPEKVDELVKRLEQQVQELAEKVEALEESRRS